MYFSVALVVSVTAGFVLEKLGFERYVREEAYQQPVASGCGAAASTGCGETVTSSCGETTSTGCGSSDTPAQAVESRWVRIWKATWKDFKQVVPYLLLGICLGSFIYGFIPTDLIAKYAGDATWYAIPVAAVIGIPLYIRAEAVIPLSAALVKRHGAWVCDGADYRQCRCQPHRSDFAEGYFQKPDDCRLPVCHSQYGHSGRSDV